MVHMWAEKNTALSLQHPLSFKRMITVNQTGYNVKVDVFVTDEDMLVVKVIDVNEDSEL